MLILIIFKISCFILGGGGGGDNAKFDPKSIDYTVYIRYDAMSTSHQPCFFADGNLNRAQLECLFKRTIASKNVITKLKNDRLVYFGVTGVFAERMQVHNNRTRLHFVADKVDRKSFADCLLVEAGSKFKIEDGSEVVVTRNDIRRLELIAIFEFTFGGFSQYSASLANQRGGGELSDGSDVFYYRFGKLNSEQRNKDKEDGSYFGGEIPRTSDGKVDWQVLVPYWLLVSLCGDLLQPERSEYFSYYFF